MRREPVSQRGMYSHSDSLLCHRCSQRCSSDGMAVAALASRIDLLDRVPAPPPTASAYLLHERKPMIVTLMTAALALASASKAVAPPAPYGPVPTPRQLKWHEMEMYGFVHFTINTFTDREWGHGDESPALFSPTDFSADQIVRTAKDAGLRGIVLTCKHHDGFCLWPSRFTDHSIKQSPWRGGNGDLVREMSDACKRNNMRFGIYLSPWDRNRSDYGRPEYIQYYRNQLRELLTGYGPIFEIWFDGANGGDGYYGGARETRKIDPKTYYDWDYTRQIVRDLQPDAVMFSDAGPDVRWVGNESGVAGDPCWHTLNPEGLFPGVADSQQLNRGDRPGSAWIPAEVDVSVRPGWFYHASEDSKVKTPQQLLDIYYNSVGRGANLILNLPPDRRGRIHETDVASLREWGRILKATFAKDLVRGAKVTASNTRGGDKRFGPASVVDGNPETYWSTDDAVTTPELTIETRKPVTFNVVRLREYLPLGQRIDTFAIDQWDGNRWVEFYTGTAIGRQRLVRVQSVTTSRVRLRITSAPVCPAISEIGLYAEPTR